MTCRTNQQKCAKSVQKVCNKCAKSVQKVCKKCAKSVQHVWNCMQQVRNYTLCFEDGQQDGVCVGGTLLQNAPIAPPDTVKTPKSM